ncbi:MAG: hypothetical protein AAF725_02000 [Acidobacteriota bacterium]
MSKSHDTHPQNASPGTARARGVVRAPGNSYAARLSRRVLALPTLGYRAALYPRKKWFMQRLANTYQANRINLFLAFSKTHGVGRQRLMALQGVADYLRNTALYKTPKIWRGFDVHNQEALETALSMGKGLVVAGQHVGPQRYSFTEISGRVGDLMAAMTEQFIDEGQDWIDRVIEDLGEGPQVDAARALTLLPVEEPTCALKMVRTLKSGGAVMFDLDGNIGVGGEEQTLKGSMQLEFFGRQVFVRGGVAYLSYRTGAPILPLISVWGPSGRPELHYFDPIVPEEGEGRKDFEVRALSQLYAQLEDVIRQHPTQWEMWPHFYKWLASPPKLDQGALARQKRAFEGFEAQLDAGTLSLAVDPSHAAVLSMRGHELFVDAKGFRFFLASPLSRKMLERLYRGTPLGRLVHNLERAGFSRSDILTELSRLEILDLLQETARTPVTSRLTSPQPQG